LGKSWMPSRSQMPGRNQTTDRSWIPRKDPFFNSLWHTKLDAPECIELLNSLATTLNFRCHPSTNSWYDTLFPSGTEACHNLVGLSPNAHDSWGRAYFALQPIEFSEDANRPIVRFFWLPPRQNFSEASILQRPSLPLDLDHGP
jgi:hypothetical protein